MASIVKCPGCQKRIKIGGAKSGAKLKCPGCNTPFVLGNRTADAADGSEEYLAFELFDEEEDIPDAAAFALPPPAKAQPKPAPPIQKPGVAARIAPSAQKPAPKPPPPPKPAKKPDTLLPDDLDLFSDAGSATEPESTPAVPPRPEPKVTQPTPPKVEASPAKTPKPPVEELPPEPMLPDNFAGLVEDAPHRPSSAPPPPEMKPELKPTPKAPVKDEDFFLPTNFDLNAFVTAKTNPEPKPTIPDFPSPSAAIPGDFEVVTESVRVGADGVPIIEGVTEADEEEIAQAESEFSEVETRSDRSERRRLKRQRRAVRESINSEVRGRWSMVFWGVTFEVVASAMFLFSLALVVVALLCMLLAVLLKSPIMITVAALVFVGFAGLAMLSSLMDLIGRGLSIPCPAKNNAMIWAILSAFTGAISIFVGITMPVGHVFYLIFLKFAADAMREPGLAEEAMGVLKLMIVNAIAIFVLSIMFGIIWATGVASGSLVKTVEDAKLLGWILATVVLVFIIVVLILAAAVTFRYFNLVSEFRREIKWRLEG